MANSPTPLVLLGFEEGTPPQQKRFIFYPEAYLAGIGTLQSLSKMRSPTRLLNITDTPIRAPL